MEDLIPKIAHFVWLGSVLPESHQIAVERFKELHPGWETKVWLQYPSDLPEYIRGLLQTVSGAKSRAEIIRLWVLHKHGGVYLDFDIYLLSPIDQLLRKQSFLSLTYHNRVVIPCVFGSAANSDTTSWLIGALRNFTGNPNEPDAFGVTLFTRMRAEQPEIAHYLPEHYFCLFRVGSVACQFLLKDEAGRNAELEGMWKRMPDDTRPIGIHTWGEDFWAKVCKRKSASAPTPEWQATVLPAPSASSISPETIEEVGLLTKARNLAKAAGRVGKNLVSGKKILVSDEEYRRRLKICNGDPDTGVAPCRFLRKGNCTKCGCVTAYKNRLTTEHCPVGLWSVIGWLFLPTVTLSGFFQLLSDVPRLLL